MSTSASPPAVPSSSSKLTTRGACLCGRVRLVLHGAPLQPGATACYCSNCQRNSGSTGQIGVTYLRSQLEIVEDAEWGAESTKEEAPVDLNGLGSAAAKEPEAERKSLIACYAMADAVSPFPIHKYFCRVCGCTLWVQPQSFGGQVIVLRVSVLDGGVAKYKPTEEVFCCYRPGWLPALEGAAQFELLPPR